MDGRGEGSRLRDGREEVRGVRGSKDWRRKRKGWENVGTCLEN